MQKIKFFTAFVVIVSLVMIVQGFSCISNRYDGPKVKENRDVSGFRGIEVSNGIDVYLSIRSDEQVDVEAPEDLLEHLVTEVNEGVLKIYYDRPFNWNSEAKVWVDAKEIDMVNTSGGAYLRGENVIETRDLELGASGGSDLNLEIVAKNVDVDVSGGSDIVLSGSAKFLKASTSGGSDLKAYDLIIQRAQLEASGGSDIRVYVQEELDATVSGGADISYMGNPQLINTNTSATGDITHRN